MGGTDPEESANKPDRSAISDLLSKAERGPRLLYSKPFRGFWRNWFFYLGLGLAISLGIVSASALGPRSGTLGWPDAALMGFFGSVVSIYLGLVPHYVGKKLDREKVVSASEFETIAQEAHRLEKHASELQLRWLQFLAIVHAGVIALWGWTLETLDEGSTEWHLVLGMTAFIAFALTGAGLATWLREFATAARARNEVGDLRTGSPYAEFVKRVHGPPEIVGAYLAGAAFLLVMAWWAVVGYAHWIAMATP